MDGVVKTSGSQVRIGEDKILRVNDTPFFPIGARHMPSGTTPRILGETGFNCMRWLAFGAGPMSRDNWDKLDKLDELMFYPYLFDRGDLSQDGQRKKDELTQLLELVKDHPRLLCYEQRNEPACTASSELRDLALMQSPPEGMIEASRWIREMDPHHPIRLGHMSSNLISTLRRYNEATDIVGCNPYPIILPDMRPTVRDDGRA